jgi:glucose/mannose transport system permease protein
MKVISANAQKRLAWGRYLGFAPAALIALLIYVFSMGWTLWMSLTSSSLIPVNTFVGLFQYRQLLHDERWHISVVNLGIYVSLFIVLSLALGLIMAIALDKKVRFENSLRTIYLYPQGMSFIVTGLAWQWILDPQLGLQQLVRGWGFHEATIDWLTRPDTAIYVVAFAGVWQSAGLVMAILLAGLRGIDGELIKAARVEGISTLRYYLHIAIPLLAPMFATALVLLAVGGVKVYELVVAMTNGGPGISSEVPAKFVMEYLFRRANIGMASAAATVMLVTVTAVIVPFIYVQHFRKRKPRAAR